MKKAIMIITSVLFPVIAFGGEVTATINSSCILQNATITVPAGQAATAFVVKALSNGTSCSTGGTPDSKGWGITLNGNKVYYWSQWQANAPSEIGGPLSGLSLGPGTYQVFVDGGSGANANISFNL
ncbi:MAG: hypothetical protein HN348_04195 [Proteobacteria bacterium]|jgi:hypothetical protein|nr:hypothetical protein [Pseudomonadota bacterium]